MFLRTLLDTYYKATGDSRRSRRGPSWFQGFQVTAFPWSLHDPFLSAPFVFWHCFTGPLATPTSTARAGPGKPAPATAIQLPAKPDPPVSTDQLLQESSVWTNAHIHTRVSANEGLSSSHSYPPRLYQQRSAAGAQPNLYFFSLQNNIQEVIQNANTSNQLSILCRRRLEKVSPCPLPALPGQMQHKTPVAPVLPCFTPSSCSPPLRSTRTCPRDKQLDLGAEIPCEQDSQRSKRHSRCL